MPWGPRDWEAWPATPATTREEDLSLAGLLREVLQRIPGAAQKSVLCLGGPTAPALAHLTETFRRAVAIDESAESVRRLRSVVDAANLTCKQRSFETPARPRVDAIVAIDSVRGNLGRIDRILAALFDSLVEGGILMATFAAAPRRAAAAASLISPPSAEEAADVGLHEVQLQYRLMRCGFQGLCIGRVRREDRREQLVCTVVRRGLN